MRISTCHQVNLGYLILNEINQTLLSNNVHQNLLFASKHLYQLGLLERESFFLQEKTGPDITEACE